jgi:glutaconate CoA-transferase subunit B
VITDLGVLVPDSVTKELMVSQLHPGVSREQIQEATGWDLKFLDTVTETELTTEEELTALRDLIKRTEESHAS